MRNLRTLGFALSSALVIGLAGCSDKAVVEEKTKVSTPDGTTTVKKETTVETSGSNPPPAAAPGASGAGASTTPSKP